MVQAPCRHDRPAVPVLVVVRTVRLRLQWVVCRGFGWPRSNTAPTFRDVRGCTLRRRWQVSMPFIGVFVSWAVHHLACTVWLDFHRLTRIAEDGPSRMDVGTDEGGVTVLALPGDLSQWSGFLGGPKGGLENCCILYGVLASLCLMIIRWFGSSTELNTSTTVYPGH